MTGERVEIGGLSRTGARLRLADHRVRALQEFLRDGPVLGHGADDVAADATRRVRAVRPALGNG